MASYSEPKWLEEKYHSEDMSQAEMAKLVGVRSPTISYHMRKYDVKRRNPHNELPDGLSERGKELLDGEMLGDGNLTFGRPTAVFQHGVTAKLHSRWVQSALEAEGFETRVDERVGQGEWSAGNIEYRLRTLSYLCLADVRSRWYTGPPRDSGNPSKQVPQDFKLSPTALLHWHMGDGCYSTTGYSSSVYLSTNDFSDCCHELLLAELDRVGIGATVRSDGVIRVRTLSVDRYFEFIDGPPDAAKAAKPGRFPG